MLSYIRGLELKVEATEAQRKKDIEKAETQRKKDIEKAETQRKKDLEKAEMQRKKDLEKAETQRKKNQSDADDRTHKLKLDLEGKIKCLELQANERELEKKQADEATKRYIESLAEDIEATTDLLAVGVCLLSFHSLNLASHSFLPRTRRRWIESNVETSRP